MLFSQELRDDVLAEEVTVSFRLWKRPKVKPGGRYPVGPGSGLIEVDSIELIPFADITDTDVRRAGEPDRERCGTALRTRARSTTERCCTGWSSTPYTTGEPLTASARASTAVQDSKSPHGAASANSVS